MVAMVAHGKCLRLEQTCNGPMLHPMCGNANCKILPMTTRPYGSVSRLMGVEEWDSYGETKLKWIGKHHGARILIDKWLPLAKGREVSDSLEGAV